jgi:hypothetical protein
VAARPEILARKYVLALQRGNDPIPSCFAVFADFQKHLMMAVELCGAVLHHPDAWRVC